MKSTITLMRIWHSFWEWFREPMSFPRDHWYRREVIVIWDEYIKDAQEAEQMRTQAAEEQHHETTGADAVSVA